MPNKRDYQHNNSQQRVAGTMTGMESAPRDYKAPGMSVNQTVQREKPKNKKNG